MLHGRAYFRRRRAIENDPHRPRWFEVPEDPDPDDDPPEYDRFGMMMKIDQMEKPWRDLINEHGFSWAMKAKADGLDPKSAAHWLAGVRQSRQWRNPNGEIQVDFR